MRMSCVSSDQMPEASALPARLWPSGPGNMSGKIVRTVARHIVALPRQHHYDTPCGDIDLRHGVGREWQHECLTVRRRRNLDDVACTEIMNRGHGSDRCAVMRLRRKS